MNKKGLSDVISTILIILLTIVAISIVWIYISGIISNSTDDSSFVFSRVQMKIFDVKKGGEFVNVSVERLVGEGEVSKLRFFLYDEFNSGYIDEDTNIGVLERELFSLNVSEISNTDVNVSDLKEIKIAPVIKAGSNKESVGSALDSYTFN